MDSEVKRNQHNAWKVHKNKYWLVLAMATVINSIYKWRCWGSESLHYSQVVQSGSEERDYVSCSTPSRLQVGFELRQYGLKGYWWLLQHRLVRIQGDTAQCSLQSAWDTVSAQREMNYCSWCGVGFTWLSFNAHWSSHTVVQLAHDNFLCSMMNHT